MWISLLIIHTQTTCYLCGQSNLTHLALNKIVEIVKYICWIKMIIFWLNIHWSLFLYIQFTVCQPCLGNGLGQNKWQAFLWTNVDDVLKCCMASLGHSELIKKSKDLCEEAGPHFNMKITFTGIGIHYKGETVVRLSYLYNENSYTSKTASR